MQDSGWGIVVEAINLELGPISGPKPERHTTFERASVINGLNRACEIAFGVGVIGADHIMGCVDEAIFSGHAFIGDHHARVIHCDGAHGELNLNEIVEPMVVGLCR